MFEDHHLFDGRGPDKKHSDDHLLAEMMAILGPPPAKFLLTYDESQKYWDKIGKSSSLMVVTRFITPCWIGRWKGKAKIPDLSLEDSEEYLEGENKMLFLQFMRKMLRWDPDERQTAQKLLTDRWLNSP